MMSKLNALSVLFIGAGLTACQTTTVVKDDHYVEGQEARIRLYGQNQKPTIMTYEQSGKKVKINVGGAAGDAFSSLVGTVKNSSIGIAPTQASQQLQQQNGVLSKAFYKEFVIPAGQSIHVRNGFIGLSNVVSSASQTTIQYQGSCRGPELTFTSVVGKDYEVIANSKGSTCGVTILEVDATGNTQVITLK